MIATGEFLENSHAIDIKDLIDEEPEMSEKILSGLSNPRTLQ